MTNFVKISRAAVAGLATVCCLSLLQAAAEPVERAEQTAKVNSLAAVVIGVSDIDTALEFYTSVLGLELARAIDTEQYLERIMSSPNGEGSRIVLFQSLEDDTLAKTRVVFYTDDAAGVVEQMRARELEIIHEPAILPGTPVIVGIAKDEDGTVLEFIQLPVPSE
ncbi:MAG: VOC family protein [Hyphomonas sp.]